MKYYVVADVHGFYSKMLKALEEKGFFEDKEPHRLILCGDMLDRGEEALDMQKFMLDLLGRGELIFIRGNHEDLMLHMLEQFETEELDLRYRHRYHVSNGTVNTALQLAGMRGEELYYRLPVLIKRVKNSPFISKLIDSSVDYFETERYIFVHGWIPAIEEIISPYDKKYFYREDWREASCADWQKARWLNGMEMACSFDIKENGKTIVCGHWHTSYGHRRYGKSPEEFGADADFSPFYSDGIIAIDACTAYSGKVNCIVIED